MKRYGIPYMGSKCGILKNICSIFPSAENFYDLFGGGFSVTHFMAENRSKDYSHFHFNEIRPGICDLINKAIHGKYNYNKFKPKFVSREEFFAKKDIDPYYKMIWSFGNNGRNYLFSKKIERYKKSMHNAIVFNDFDSLAKKTLGINSFDDNSTIKERRLFLRSKIHQYAKSSLPGCLISFVKKEQLEQLKQLEQLERLERLQQLERLEKIKFYNKDYREVPIFKNSIIYCDPPYNNTAEYDSDFNHKEFLEWCDGQSHPVFISEYNISDNRFRCVFKIKKISKFQPNGGQEKEEKIYINKAGFKSLLKQRRKNGST